MAKKIAVLLHGAGVFDGTEIHESVISLLALAEQGLEYQCFSIDQEQLEVINHLTGEPIREYRNTLVESARIARGEIKPLIQLEIDQYDGMVIPGGFGTAKNLTTWAQKGANGSINPLVQEKIVAFVSKRKPIAALCMSCTTVAKALEGSPYTLTLSAGNTSDKSLYNISEIHHQIQQTGHQTQETDWGDISIDKTNRIVSAPCYMMDVDLPTLKSNIYKAIDALKHLL